MQSQSNIIIKKRKDYQPPDFTISQIFLDFKLNKNKTLVSAESQVSRLNKKASQLILDGINLKLKKVMIDNKKLHSSEYEVTNENLIIPIQKSQFTLTIETEINPFKNTSLEGLYQSNGIFCTQCEAEGFRKITYFLDRPDVLAEYTVRIEADKKKYPYLLSNGNKIKTGINKNHHFVVWHDPYPKPCYLFALVAGNLDFISNTFITKNSQTVQLEIYVDKGKKQLAEYAMSCLKKAMRWDEERFNLQYDLNIYMIVAVDFFNMGAMENKGLNIFNSKAILADKNIVTDDEFSRIDSIIAHEYFHNWTGNRITCRDWFQLSLKEGLTVFRDQEYSADTGNRTLQRIKDIKFLIEHQFPEDESTMAHAIRPEEVIEMNNFYTHTVYEKGAEVIRMLHTLLGEDGFQKGFLQYITSFDGQAVTCDDFIESMEIANDIDLTQFKLWYSQSGTPLVKLITKYNASEKTYIINATQTLTQNQNQKEKAPLFIPIHIELINKKGQLIKLINQGNLVDPILYLTEESQSWLFEKVNGPVFPSFFVNLSAPVKYQYQYNNKELGHLTLHAKNSYSQWDAIQKLYLIEITNITEKQQQNASTNLIFAIEGIIKKTLNNQISSIGLVAEILTIPESHIFFNRIKGIDIINLHYIRNNFINQISQSLLPEITDLYLRYNNIEYENEQQGVEIRKLKRAILFLLSMARQSNVESLILVQYENSTNMTEKYNILQACVASNLSISKQLLKNFYIEWQDNSLVMDKYFTLIGNLQTHNALETIKNATLHPMFSFENPNKVRALIGTFSEKNIVAFHANDGLGYEFFTDIIIKLNQINPQVAARLITPLAQWKDHTEERQELMKMSLHRILETDNLSKDVYEKVAKSLNII